MFKLCIVLLILGIFTLAEYVHAIQNKIRKENRADGYFSRHMEEARKARDSAHREKFGVGEIMNKRFRKEK